MLKQQLQQKLQQKLSPLQIQLIRMLELPTIELEERVKHELEENPALEEGKEPLDDLERNEEGGSADGEDDYPSEGAENEDLSLGDYLSEDDIPEYKLQQISERAARQEEFSLVEGDSLRDYLLEQLRLRNLSEKQVKIAEYIIGNIDDDGYLRRDLPAVADEEIFGIAFKTGARSSEGHHCPLPRHEERKGIGQI